MVKKKTVAKKTKTTRKSLLRGTLTKKQAIAADRKNYRRLLREEGKIASQIQVYKKAGVSSDVIRNYDDAATKKARQSFKKVERAITIAGEKRIDVLGKEAAKTVAKTAAKKAASKSIWGGLKIAGKLLSKVAGPVGAAMTAYEIGSFVNNSYQDAKQANQLGKKGHAAWQAKKRTTIAGGSLQQKFQALSPAQKAQFKTLDKAGRKAMLEGGGKGKSGGNMPLAQRDKNFDKGMAKVGLGGGTYALGKSIAKAGESLMMRPSVPTEILGVGMIAVGSVMQMGGGLTAVSGAANMAGLKSGSGNKSNSSKSGAYLNKKAAQKAKTARPKASPKTNSGKRKAAAAPQRAGRFYTRVVNGKTQRVKNPNYGK